MTSTTKNAMQRALHPLLSHPSAQQGGIRLINLLASAFRLDLLRIAYNRIGVLNYKTMKESGEEYLLEALQKHYLNAYKNPVIFDVGANVGDYSIILARNFPNAKIFAFEPLPAAFGQLRANLSTSGTNVVPLNVALGDVEGEGDLFLDATQPTTSHASLHRSVLSELHGYSTLKSERVPILTIDKVAETHCIDQIAFLKIDAEGHEYSILTGAENMLARDAIHLIQFEFNEMNIVSRVFLKDFFNLLTNFQIFRVLPDRLLPLDYSAKHEIFAYQNLFAVHSNLISKA